MICACVLECVLVDDYLNFCLFYYLMRYVMETHALYGLFVVIELAVLSYELRLLYALEARD